MKIFITGGAGFIGSNLVDALMLDGHSVCVYDNLVTGKKEHIIKHIGNSNFCFLQKDTLDLKTLKRSMKGGFDVVFHLSSNADIAKSMKQTDIDLKQGTIATFNVLESMRVNNIDKIVFVSGSGVYGDVGTTYTAEDFGPLTPISMYGASKLSAESMISAFSHMFGIKAWIFRLANIVGKRQTHGVIFDFINKLNVNAKQLEIFGNGKQSKSYLHVQDVINAILFCLDKSNARVNIYNVATLDYLTVTDIAKLVVKIMGLKRVKFLYTGGARGWKGDVPIVRLDTTKINNAGWKPALTSREAIIRAIEENLTLCR